MTQHPTDSQDDPLQITEEIIDGKAFVRLRRASQMARGERGFVATAQNIGSLTRQLIVAAECLGVEWRKK